VEIKVKRTPAVDEFLDPLVNEELEPVREEAMELRCVAAGEVGAADRPRVRDEDAGHGGCDWEEIIVNEDERGGTPDHTPSAGLSVRACGILEGEAGDDVVNGCVGRGVDAVDEVARGEVEEPSFDGDKQIGKSAVCVEDQARQEPFTRSSRCSGSRPPA
jgi:hypothetical protein